MPREKVPLLLRQRWSKKNKPVQLKSTSPLKYAFKAALFEGSTFIWLRFQLFESFFDKQILCTDEKEHGVCLKPGTSKKERSQMLPVSRSELIFVSF